MLFKNKQSKAKVLKYTSILLSAECIKICHAFASEFDTNLLQKGVRFATMTYLSRNDLRIDLALKYLLFTLPFTIILFKIYNKCNYFFHYFFAFIGLFYYENYEN